MERASFEFTWIWHFVTGTGCPHEPIVVPTLGRCVCSALPASWRDTGALPLRVWSSFSALGLSHPCASANAGLHLFCAPVHIAGTGVLWLTHAAIAHAALGLFALLKGGSSHASPHP